MDKSAVMGLLERHGPDGHSRVRVKHVPNVRRKTLAPEVRQHVEPGASVYSDALKSYEGLAQDYTHEVIDHAEAYVKAPVHTNGMENFWSLLKRGIKGTYVSVEPFHLFRYPGRAGLSVQQPEGHRLAPLRPGHALYPGQATHLQGAHRGWARIGYDVRAEANGVSLCLPVGMRDLKPDSKRATGGLGVLLGQQELECIGEMLHCHEVNAIVGHCHHILAIRTDEWPRVPVLRGNADDRLAAPTLEPDSHQIRKANDEAILYCHEPTSTGE